MPPCCSRSWMSHVNQWLWLEVFTWLQMLSWRVWTVRSHNYWLAATKFKKLIHLYQTIYPMPLIMLWTMLKCCIKERLKKKSRLIKQIYGSLLSSTSKKCLKGNSKIHLTRMMKTEMLECGKESKLSIKKHSKNRKIIIIRIIHAISMKFKCILVMII